MRGTFDQPEKYCAGDDRQQDTQEQGKALNYWSVRQAHRKIHDSPPYKRVKQIK